MNKENRYYVKHYYPESNEHLVADLVTGRTYLVDLFVDSTFPDSPINYEMTIEQRDEACFKMVGDVVEIEEFMPVQYAAKNVKHFKKAIA